MTMYRLSDDELFTSPLTFMGAPYGRPGPGNKAADPRHPVRLRHQHAHRRARRPRFGAPAIGADAPLQSHPCRLRSGGGARPGRLRQRQAHAQRRSSTPSSAPSRRSIASSQAGAIPITIGGDGSVTVPVARAVGKKHQEDGGAAHRLAHRFLSLRRRRKSTTRRPSSPMSPRRAWSIRNSPGMSASAARPTPRASCRARMSLGYKVVSLDELIRGGFAQRMAEFRDKVGKRPVYLCFDMDVFDPSTAPGVCTPSWGGLTRTRGHRPAALPDRSQYRRSRCEHREPAAGRERHGRPSLRPRDLRNARSALQADGSGRRSLAAHMGVC